MIYEPGQVVMFKEIKEAGDEEMRFSVIEDWDTKLLVQALGTKLPFPPQNTFAKDEFVLAPDHEQPNAVAPKI